MLKLSRILENLSYTCGALFDDLDMSEDLKSVCIRAHKCYDPVEKLYYSCFPDDPICIYCSRTVTTTENDSDKYTQCVDCSSKPPVKKYKRGRK